MCCRGQPTNELAPPGLRDAAGQGRGMIASEISSRCPLEQASERTVVVVDRHDEDSERPALDLLLRGFQVSRLLRLVADLGIADRIAPDAHVTIAVLAGQCGVQAQPLIRVLRALASFGVFTLTVDGDIGHTPRSRLLRTDTPNSMHYSARFWTAPGTWSTWGMLDVALTGGVAHEAAWKMGRFDYLRAHPDEARGFDAMMANFPGNGHAAIAAAYDFSGAN